MSPENQTPRPHDYPTNFAVDYPERTLHRGSTAARLVLAIPIILLLALVQQVEIRVGWQAIALSLVGSLSGIGAVTFPVLVMLVLRRKYPHWWFEWNVELFRFINRVIVYLVLMTDQYPSTDEAQSVRLHFPDPQGQGLSRGLPLVKWLLAVPHYAVLVAFLVSLPFVLIVAWVSIIATGRYPRRLFSYVEGILRWGNRVIGYAFIFVTDDYPPFRLSV
jgi:hypothetical protein